MADPYSVVREFESALAEYTGAPRVVTCTSCTMAILLAASWRIHAGGQREACIPKYTYIGVPMALMHAGYRVEFRGEAWSGSYVISPLRIIDSARRFHRNMYLPGTLMCMSFHPSKILGLSTHGGAILLDDPEAHDWLKMARFDGRRENVPPAAQNFTVIGWHCYMNPVTAAEGLTRLATLPDWNEDLPWDQYPDLSAMEIFR